jgi:hypothetical protein
MSEEAWLVTSVLPAIAHGLGAALGRFATSRIQHRPISAPSFLSAPRRGPLKRNRGTMSAARSSFLSASWLELSLA